VIVLLWLAQMDPLPSAIDGGLVRAAVGTCAVLAILAVLAVLLRRGVLTIPGQRGSRSLAIETALPIGDRRSVVILNVEGRRLLLGLTPAQVSVLAELGSTKASFDHALDRAGGTGQVTPL
jgi:flagellar biosynthetic protein FliO